MEKQRRCGWVAGAKEGPERVVWARRGIAVSECPRSLITAESLRRVEEFHVWKLSGRLVEPLTARQVEALCVLENEWRKELADERH